MFNYEMDLCSYFTCLHVLELLLFIAAIISYGIYLSYMIVLFGIKIFNIYKYVESMPLISLILQRYMSNASCRAGPARARFDPARNTLAQARPAHMSCRAGPAHGLQ